MSRLQRDRGATTEREIANYLSPCVSEQLGTVVKRKLGQARDSGEDISIPPFRIEVKRRRGFVGLSFLTQAETGAEPGEIPMVIVRVDGDMRPVVLVRLEEFVKLMREELHDK